MKSVRCAPWAGVTKLFHSTGDYNSNHLSTTVIRSPTPTAECVSPIEFKHAASIVNGCGEFDDSLPINEDANIVVVELSSNSVDYGWCHKVVVIGIIDFELEWRCDDRCWRLVLVSRNNLQRSVAGWNDNAIRYPFSSTRTRSSASSRSR